MLKIVGSASKILLPGDYLSIAYLLKYKLNCRLHALIEKLTNVSADSRLPSAVCLALNIYVDIDLCSIALLHSATRAMPTRC